MPQLIALALIGGLGWYAWSQLRKHMEKIGEELDGHGEPGGMKNVDALEQDEDGVYRPKKKQ